MTEQQISLKTVNDLRLDDAQSPQRFFIPAYQRGYRWSTLQVEQLLGDVLEFTKTRNLTTDEFYCLQPLVVKKRQEGGFEVVDGQQRLTTLLLILRHFNDRTTKEYRMPLYHIDYATRASLDDFLENPTEAMADENVDFFHLYRAIDTIKQWFGVRSNEIRKLEDAFLNDIKVIWFQLTDNDNPVDAFTRLNVGKIPLTNDELIRALFLRRANPDDREAANTQMQIAHEWDQIEKALQSNAFWYFLSNETGKEQSRIGFLFELFALSEGMQQEVDDPYRVFYTFSERLKEPGALPKREWSHIKQLFLTLEEWYEDRTLYHLIGFLVHEKLSLNRLRDMAKDCRKSEFETRLRKAIYKKTIGQVGADLTDEPTIREYVEEKVESLAYGRSNDPIRSLLLLFNLATLLRNDQSNIRFQFDNFKNAKWDIEHVRSVTNDKPMRPDSRREWLGHCLGYLESQDNAVDLREQITRFLDLSQTEATEDLFDFVYDAALSYFGEASEGESENGIANLTLLDYATNRSYKNAVFAVKRQQLLNRDRDGIFVPLCTRNVFLKCYSLQVDNALFWTKSDQEGYQSAISETLIDFFFAKQETSK